MLACTALPLRAAILPCTPLAIVKTLEHMRVYNPVLPYGQRAYGRTITVINRSVCASLSIESSD